MTTQVKITNVNKRDGYELTALTHAFRNRADVEIIEIPMGGSFDICARGTNRTVEELTALVLDRIANELTRAFTV